jgi:hypothetical protein
MVQLYIQFRSRRPGSFGTSALGQAMEWCTRTWLRFTCLLGSILFGLLALFSSMPLEHRVAMLALAPVASVFYWYVFLFLLLISRYLGRWGGILANLLILYFYLFSRLVVQTPPAVYLPLTRGGSSV